jgi:hypothetical protein
MFTTSSSSSSSSSSSQQRFLAPGVYPREKMPPHVEAP